MSDISRIILNTMLYEINNSNTSKSVSNNESFSKLLQSSIGLLGSSSSDCSCSNSGVSSLGMIVTLTGLINQNRIYESNSNINNNLDSLDPFRFFLATNIATKLPRIEIKIAVLLPDPKTINPAKKLTIK